MIAIGLAYDLRLKGTAWSWLPFAIGIPILPVFGWVGATGSLPPAFVVLVPAAVAAGAALAIGNALVDVERDRAAGASVGRGGVRTRPDLAHRRGPPRGDLDRCRRVGRRGRCRRVAVLAIALVGAVPVACRLPGRACLQRPRERAWQAEAIGLAVLAALWLAR